MSKDTTSREMQELIMVRNAYRRVLQETNLEVAAKHFPLKVGFRTDFGYALEIQKVILKYNLLLIKAAI